MPGQPCPHCGEDNMYLKNRDDNNEHDSCYGKYYGKCVRELWYCRACRNTWTRWTCERYE